MSIHDKMNYEKTSTRFFHKNIAFPAFVISKKSLIISFCFGRGFSEGLSVISAKVSYVFKSNGVCYLGNRKAPLVQQRPRSVHTHKISVLDRRHTETLSENASERIYAYITCFRSLSAVWNQGKALYGIIPE